jgi:hypothetical protein
VEKEKSQESIKGRYRHYKGGRYEVLGVAWHSESREELVVYRPLDAQEEPGLPELWVRPKAMFFDVLDIEGRETERFSKEK